MILAVGALLHYAGDTSASADDVEPAVAAKAETASRAVYEAVLETVAGGHPHARSRGATPAPPSSPMR